MHDGDGNETSVSDETGDGMVKRCGSRWRRCRLVIGDKALGGAPLLSV